MSEHFYLGQYEYGDDTGLAEWIKANDVEPADVVHESVAQIHDNHLTFVVFMNADGRKIMDQGRCLKEFRTVPLTARPESFGL